MTSLLFTFKWLILVKNAHFSLQPTLVTREKQLEAWARLVLDYAQHNKIYTLDVSECATTELFNNQKLNSENLLIFFIFNFPIKYLIQQ